MLLLLELFWGLAGLELLLWLLPLSQVRRYGASFLAVALTAVATSLFMRHPSVPTGIVLAMSAYRVCNLLRVVKARINEKYLSRVGMQASVWVIALQAVTMLLWEVGLRLNISTYHLWLTLAYAGLVVSMVLLVTTTWQLRKTRVPALPDKGLSDSDLPTLTVAIPARNETDELRECLESLVGSNYPKLEILVLDDCSQNKRTPEIIRSFAHDGALFIKGREPEANWLAKNQAYQRLFEEANGELVLFCGVDVRFEPASLRRLVTAMLQKKKSMMSIIPKNAMPPTFVLRDTSLLQPMRYAWELAFPRRLFRRPPVLSTCWIVKRDLLKSAGGFAGVSRSIVPESYFARVSTVHDGYSFMQSNDVIGITSRKLFSAQLETAVRTRYPQLHRRMELVLGLTMVELVGVLMPYVLLAVALLGHLSLQLTVVSLLTILAFMFVYVRIVALTYRHWLARSFLLLPVAVLVDAVLLNYSMIRYEFFSVIWKGRNVCIPVMRVVEQLPKPD